MTRVACFGGILYVLLLARAEHAHQVATGAVSATAVTEMHTYELK